MSVPHPLLAEVGAEVVVAEVVVLRRATTSAGSQATTTSADVSPTASADRRLDLDHFDRDERVAAVLAKTLGIAQPGCPRCTRRLEGADLDVEWWIDEDERYVLMLRGGWPPPAPKSLCLAQVFAIWVLGEPKQERGPSLARWRLRMLVDLGFIDPADVRLAALPHDADEDAAETWEVIRRLLSYRRLEEPVGEPVALSTPTLAAWFQTDELLLRRGKNWLEKHGFISRAGTLATGRPRPLILWRVPEKPDRPGGKGETP
jgi:hypothetical protein